MSMCPWACYPWRTLSLGPRSVPGSCPAASGRRSTHALSWRRPVLGHVSVLVRPRRPLAAHPPSGPGARDSFPSPRWGRVHPLRKVGRPQTGTAPATHVLLWTCWAPLRAPPAARIRPPRGSPGRLFTGCCRVPLPGFPGPRPVGGGVRALAARRRGGLCSGPDSSPRCLMPAALRLSSVPAILLTTPCGVRVIGCRSLALNGSFVATGLTHPWALFTPLSLEPPALGALHCGLRCSALVTGACPP